MPGYNSFMCAINTAWEGFNKKTASKCRRSQPNTARSILGEEIPHALGGTSLTKRYDVTAAGASLWHT